MGHARCLLALESIELILEAKRAILEEGLSVRAAEALVARLKKATPQKRKRAVVGSLGMPTTVPHSAHPPPDCSLPQRPSALDFLTGTMRVE